jgi:23S rRNA (cytosine1962-C5)-methyltransferase
MSMSQNFHEVIVRPRGLTRIRNGHPWIFRDDVSDDAGAAGGEIVRIASRGGTTVGFGSFSRHSKIALRLIGGPERIPDRSYWIERLERALDFRGRVVSDATAYRCLFGESDGFPGLVADRYGSHLVVQCLTAGAERILEMLLSTLCEVHGIESVLARNDASVRTLEGLPRETRQIVGTTPQLIEVQEGGVAYRVDPWKGQKTGSFLDQRENRARVAPLCRGRVLDAFSYQAGFALQAARHAEEVLAVDSSARALQRGREDATRNGLGNIQFVEAKVFDDLKTRHRAGERFDAIVLDPPAFAKSRRDVDAAERAYLEVNRRALRLLGTDGILVTCSCSYNMSEERFLRIVAAAAAGARRSARVLARHTQSRDHPIRLGFPESQYLKCLVLNVM